MRVPFSPHPHQHLSRLFDDGQCNRCEVISHCDLDLHFPNSLRCWASFHVPIGLLYIYHLWRNVYRGLLPIFKLGCVFLLSSCMNSLFFDINPLSDVWFANIFSHSIACHFALLMVSFAVQNLFSLIWSHLFLILLLAKIILAKISGNSYSHSTSRNYLKDKSEM